ncbi:Adaptive-response sensory-kinase SasA [Austwickia sp. TVS 96-490-7B]|uniref:sensor histidine kinase n=1 Tax=Austwickia sp. TVS 96-490-7B TaxID=2830843 RepID=UPI001D500051|nr:ATP-binding protein [Austwickia sp. TVS 96-490-7B]MBW3083847.1 Adaptive-response sensory-kinase SasA [Austwickia sp. TVS 96-490-7B]
MNFSGWALLTLTMAICVAVGLVMGAGGVRRSRPGDDPGAEVTPSEALRQARAAGVADVLHVLRSGAIILDAGDAVTVASQAARALGLVRGVNLMHMELRDMARAVRRDGVTREAELELARGPLGPGTLTVQVRVALLGEDDVLLLVEDHTQALRLDAVRRDFVANVSHELKTPVGGISLLAEAVLDASDDPEAVSRFARRIRVESSRLSRLVQEIVDLSRLQSSDSLSEPVLVEVSPVAQDAVERIGTLAEAKDIQVVLATEDEVSVYGDAHMLGTAIDNLLTNAVNYSAENTRIAVGVRQVDGIVEIMVADQGQGIPEDDQERIFERFYRVDPARSRATGGTGLGLAIVKHICANHGGEVRVWSKEGQGSTFTLRIPAAADVRPAPDRSRRVAAETTSAVARSQLDQATHSSPLPSRYDVSTSTAHDSRAERPAER